MTGPNTEDLIRTGVQAMRQRVMEHVNKAFVSGTVQISEFPALPGGVLVRDKEGGEAVFYWDILRDEIAFTWPDKDGDTK